MDESVVKTLAQGLEAAKLNVWFDHDLAGGEIWWEAILRNIRAAEVVIFGLSDASLKSKPCRLELQYAQDLGRPVLPVQVGSLTAVLANPFAEVQVVDYSPNDAQSGFAVLAAVVETAHQVLPLPDPLPPQPPTPYQYIRAIGRQIESVALSFDEQAAVIETLRKALNEETDEKVRREVLDMLVNLISKPYTAKQTQRDAEFLLMQHGSAPPTPAPAPAHTPAPTVPAPATASADDPYSGRTVPLTPRSAQPRTGAAPSGRGLIDGVIAQIEEASRKQPPPRAGSGQAPRWRLGADPDAGWKRSYEMAESAGAAAGQRERVHTGPLPDPPQPASSSYWASQSQPSPQQPQQPLPQQPLPAKPVATQPLPAMPARSASSEVTPPPPNYWAMSVVSFFVSYLFGAIAVYFSYQVGQCYRAGDLNGARRASSLAKVWGLAGIVIGGLVVIAIIWGSG